VVRGAYLPAQLELGAGAPVCQRARALAKLMRTKAMFLAQVSAAHSSRLEDRLALVEQRARLANLTHNLPLLEATLDAPVVQPLALYLALCAQLGPLAALRPGTVPLAPPRYVHADSQGAFDLVLANLHALAGEISEEWKSCVFTFEHEVFSLPMRAEWMGGRLVVGLRGQSERELGQWMEDASIGSRIVSAALRDRRVPGAARRMIVDAPELGLRGSAGWTLFEIAADPQYIVADQDLLIGTGSAARHALRPQEIVLFIKG
jgi:type VI secretion system protein ImpJ